jgi:hypothetical protein
VFLKKDGVKRFGGFADNDRIPVSEIPRFKEFLDKRGQSFLEEIDDWLTEHAANNTSDKTECARIGVGLFAIEDKVSLEKSK